LSEAPIHVLVSGSAIEVLDRAQRDGMWKGRVSVPLPASVAMVEDEPIAVALPLDLATVPLRHSASVGGRGATLPVQYCIFVPGSGMSAGEEKKGFAAHPPNNGRTYADFLLTLPPADTVSLNFSVAIQDRAEASGCTFAVEVNCREEIAIKVDDADGWHPGTVDLSAYAGKTLLLTLLVDSDGPYSFDWARWGDVQITAGKP